MNIFWRGQQTDQPSTKTNHRRAESISTFIHFVPPHHKSAKQPMEPGGEPGDPPWDPCEMCLDKAEKKGCELIDEKEKKEKEGEEDNLPDSVDYCEKCDFECTTCGCRFEMLSNWFTVFAIGEALTNETHSPAAIRYRQYRYCTQITHGFLGKGKRVKQATCITEGLHTMYPNPVGVDRVGFRKKRKAEKTEEG
jgi:hypothetical protein